MSRPAWHRDGRGRIAEAALWTGAIVLVLTVHVGAAAWLMRKQPVVAADDAPPAAIMIDLAPVAEAVETEETEISEQMQDAEESTPAEDVAAPEELPPEEVDESEPVEEVAEDLPEPEPVEDIADEQTESETAEEPIETEIAEGNEPVEETVALLPDAAIPLPTRRPKPPAPKREVTGKQEAKTKPVQRTQKPRPQKQQAASRATRKARALAEQSNRNAARQTSSGVSKARQARWQSRLMAHLERRKRYPADARRRGEQGTAHVRFSIDANGNVLSASLARSSGFPELDREVVAMVRRASPVPAPPPGVNRTVTVPVRFRLR